MQINCVYGVGSTGKLTAAIHEKLARDGFESVVLYGRGKKSGSPGVYKVCSEPCAKLNNLRSRLTGLMYGGCGLSTARIISIIRREKPDVVHLQCINGYFVNIYRLVSFLRGSGIPTLLTLHAEFMFTANCSHALECERWRTGCGDCPRLKKATKSLFFDRTRESFELMRRAFENFGRLTVASVSPWLGERARLSPILARARHIVVGNGVDTGVFRRTEIPVPGEYAGKRLILHVTARFSDAPDDLKGGRYVIELAKRMSDVLFIVAGAYELSGGVPENLVLLGNVSDQRRLAGLYSAAELTLLTSLRETYSMVCAESLCCGTPVVGFKAGAPEMISLPGYSSFVESGDIGALEAETAAWLGAKERIGADRIEADARAHYDKDKMINQYEEEYRRMLCG